MKRIGVRAARPWTQPEATSSDSSARRRITPAGCYRIAGDVLPAGDGRFLSVVGLLRVPQTLLGLLLELPRAHFLELGLRSLGLGLRLLVVGDLLLLRRHRDGVRALLALG